MQELTPDKSLLIHLSKFGLGLFENISPFLVEMWPEPEWPQDYSTYVHKIKTFIGSLEKHGFIEIDASSSFGFYRKFGEWRNNNFYKLKDNPLFAAIAKIGLEYIKDETKNIPSILKVEGNNNQIIQNSSASTVSSVNNRKKEKKDVATKIKKWLAIGTAGVALIFGIAKGIVKLKERMTEQKTDTIPKAIQFIKSDSNTKSTFQQKSGNHNIQQGGSHNSLRINSPTIVNRKSPEDNYYSIKAPVLSKDSLDSILRTVQNMCPLDNGSLHTVVLSFGNNTNGQRIFQQIEDELISNGYTVRRGGSVLNIYSGIRFFDPTPPDCVWIIVGIYKQP